MRVWLNCQKAFAISFLLKVWKFWNKVIFSNVCPQIFLLDKKIVVLTTPVANFFSTWPKEFRSESKTFENCTNLWKKTRVLKVNQWARRVQLWNPWRKFFARIKNFVHSPERMKKYESFRKNDFVRNVFHGHIKCGFETNLRNFSSTTFLFFSAQSEKLMKNDNFFCKKI